MQLTSITQISAKGSSPCIDYLWFSRKCPISLGGEQSWHEWIINLTTEIIRGQPTVFSGIKRTRRNMFQKPPELSLGVWMFRTATSEYRVELNWEKVQTITIPAKQRSATQVDESLTKAINPSGVAHSRWDPNVLLPFTTYYDLADMTARMFTMRPVYYSDHYLGLRRLGEDNEMRPANSITS